MIINRLLRWTCLALFLGRAWQHLRWDAPYRALLWSQETMEPLVSGLFGVDWETFATSPAIDSAITAGTKLAGVGFVFCAFAAWLCSPVRRWTHAVLLSGALALVFLAYCTYRDRLHRAGEFFELASQFFLPLLVVLWVRATLVPERFAVLLRVAIAGTFAGHGLYAVGLYPTPGEWTTMTMDTTGMSESAAGVFLHVAGLFDFLAAAAVMLPWIRVARVACLYAAAWGLLTALARPVAFVRWENLGESSAQWLHEALVRVPHAALPFALFLLLRVSPSARLPAAEGVFPSKDHSPNPVV